MKAQFTGKCDNCGLEIESEITNLDTPRQEFYMQCPDCKANVPLDKHLASDIIMLAKKKPQEFTVTQKMRLDGSNYTERN